MESTTRSKTDRSEKGLVNSRYETFSPFDHFTIESSFSNRVKKKKSNPFFGKYEIMFSQIALPSEELVAQTERIPDFFRTVDKYLIV